MKRFRVLGLYGPVGEGVEFSDGSAAVRWNNGSTSILPSTSAVEDRGLGGIQLRIMWLDVTGA